MKHLSIFLAAGAIATFGLATPIKADEVPSCGACPSTMAKSVASKDIVDTAVGAGSFKTLAAALKAADLIPTLKGKGPFTVFAPTDDAFAALPAGTVEGLLKDKAALTRILTYHVVAGSVPASQVVNMNFADTVQGSASA